MSLFQMEKSLYFWMSVHTSNCSYALNFMNNTQFDILHMAISNFAYHMF